MDEGTSPFEPVLLRRRTGLGPSAELRLDQLLQIAVQDPVDVADLDTRSVVLDEPIGGEDVRADLLAEVDPLALAAEVLELRLLLLAHTLS